MSITESVREMLYLPIAAYMFAMTSVGQDEKALRNVVEGSRYLPFVMAYLCVDIVLVFLGTRAASYKMSMGLHHVLLFSATAYVHFWAPHLLEAYSYASFCEISASLLTLQGVFERSGADKGLLIANGAVFLASHTWTRLVMHPWLTLSVVPRVSQSSQEQWFVTGGMSALILLNVYWTWLILKKAHRTISS